MEPMMHQQHEHKNKRIIMQIVDHIHQVQLPFLAH